METQPEETTAHFWSTRQEYEISICTGSDLVHDQVEQALLHEVENLRTCQNRLKNAHEQSIQQVGSTVLL